MPPTEHGAEQYQRKDVQEAERGIELDLPIGEGYQCDENCAERENRARIPLEDPANQILNLNPNFIAPCALYPELGQKIAS